MLRNLAKGWDLCYKHKRRYLHDAYPNIYSRESMFIFQGNSTIQFDYKPNEQTK